MTNCTVCLDTLTDGPITALICGHVFHHSCISPWVASQPRCPLCKKSLSQHHRTPLIPLYLDLTGHDPLTVIPQGRSKDQHKQLQNQLQTTMQILKTERQQFEKEKRQHMNEMKDYQNLRHIKGVLELESSLNNRQLRAKIQNWKALPQDQLATRMGILVERQQSLARELDDTEVRLNSSKNRIKQLKERLSQEEVDAIHVGHPSRLKRKRSLSSTGNDSSAKRRDKRPAIDVDIVDTNDDGVSWTRTISHDTHRSSHTQQNGQSLASSSGSNSQDSDEYTGSTLAASRPRKYEVLATDSPCQQILSVIDSDDEVSHVSRAITRNKPSTRHARSSRHRSDVIVLSDDDVSTD